MMKIPKTSKYKKSHKGSLKNIVSKNFTLQTALQSGSIALKFSESGRITPNHIEASRQALNKHFKKSAQIRFTVFPHTPITKKPLEIRMGKGKGAPEYWVAPVKAGTILFEATGVSLELASEALRLAAQKLPVKTKFVVRRDHQEEAE